MGQEGKYAAFISYRHVWPDKPIAKALQWLLENNLLRPNKSFPRHIRPVFLDTSELSATEDLDGGIIQALDRAEYLFVICSPELPKSKYCMREITWFKEKHGGSLDKVALLLVRGEPEESIPRELKTKIVPDPENPGQTMEQEIEPLFADVRSKTLPGAFWKLFKTEYVRLAARYFGCSYDALKKRHRRNLIATVSAAVIAALALSGTLIHQDQQVRITEANAYAAYANEQTVLGDELKALALCTHTQCMTTDEYTTALRNAVVQLDYKQKNAPVAKVLEVSYKNSELTNYYISASGDTLVVADGHIWQLTDAENGTVISQFPYESAFVDGNLPERYIVLESRRDPSGVFQDWVSVRMIKDDSCVGEFPFRTSTMETTNYHLITVAESKSRAFKLKDREEVVAYFNADGQEITEAEFLLAALQGGEDQTAEEQPYSIVLQKLVKRYAVKDSSGNVVLNLGQNCQNYAFSEDWKYLAWAAEGTLSVYDTENWEMISQLSLEDAPQSIHMLRGSSYCIVAYRYNEERFLGAGSRSEVLDWRSGERYLSFYGTALISPTEQAFYSVIDGTITRYIYTQLDTLHKMKVIAHNGDWNLCSGDGKYVFRNAATGQTVLTLEAEEVWTDEALEYILCRNADRVVCYDRTGKTLWYVEQTAQTAAMAPDGSRCAWLDRLGTLYILNTRDGTEIARIQAESLQAVGEVLQLLVSGEGVGVVGSETTLWLRPDAGTTKDLGKFDAGTIFSDGILILERDSRVDDFCVYDTNRLELLASFEDNTGAWSYSPKTACLVRHLESAGNNASLQMEIGSIRKGKISVQGKIDLASKYVQNLRIDSSGTYVSYSAEGRSYVYRLDWQKCILNVEGYLYMDTGMLFGTTVYGDYQYTIPLHDADTLLSMAQDALSGPRGVRVLTEEEQKYYALS